MDWIRRNWTRIARVTVALFLAQFVMVLVVMNVVEDPPRWLAALFLVLFVASIPASLVVTFLGTRIKYPLFYQPAEPKMDDPPDGDGEPGRRTRPGWSNQDQRDH